MSDVHLSHLTLDALRVGDLEAEAAAEAQAHLATCERCEGVRQALQRSADDFASTFKPAVLASETLGAKEATRGRGWRDWIPALAAGAAVFVGAAIWIAKKPDDSNRLKGSGAAVEIYVMRAGAPTLSQDGVEPGSTLRVRFDAGAAAFATVRWRDEHGATTVLYEGPASGRTWIPNEIELDDATEAEWIDVRLCEAPGRNCADGSFPVRKK